MLPRVLRQFFMDLARSWQAPRLGWARPVFVASLFLSYITYLLWKPLTHPSDIMGGLDMAIYYPFKVYWIESLKRLDPALWNPYLSLGQPFMAFPSVGAYAPFNFLYFLFPAPLAFTLNTACHLFLASFGTFFLLRRLGCIWEAGFLGGMGFAFGGYVLSRSLGGQPAVWWAASWAPWVLYFLQGHLTKGRLRDLALAAGCAAFSFFEGYPQVCLYILLASGLFILGAWIGGRISLQEGFLASALFILGFLGLAVCQVLPAYDFISRSDRWNWGYDNIMTDYLAPLNLRHFVEPNFLGASHDGTWRGRWGYHEMVNYIGLVPLGLGLLGVLYLRRVPLLGWFLAVAALFTALSLGDSTAPTKALFKFFFDHVPGFSENRSIGRMMIIADLCLACAGALALDAWARMGLPWERKGPGTPPAWKRTALLVLLALTVFDLARYGRPFIGTVPAESYTAKREIFPDPLVLEALADGSHPRILPSNNILANLSWKLSQLSSPDTTYVREFAEFKNSFPGNYDSPLADLINLKYLYHGAPIPSGRWKEVFARHFVNQTPFPRAFLAGGFRLIGRPPLAYPLLANPLFNSRAELLLEKEPEGLRSEPGVAGEASIVSYGDNDLRIECVAERPCLLFLSDPFFPGWKAWVDGKPTEILRADGAFRAVGIPTAGKHEVRMSYQPTPIYLGFFISLAAWAVFGWAVFLRGRKLVLGDLLATRAWATFRAALGYDAVMKWAPKLDLRKIFTAFKTPAKRRRSSRASRAR